MHVVEDVERIKCHKEKIKKNYGVRMSESFECSGRNNTTPTPGSRTRMLGWTLNSNLVRSGEGGADPPGARWCIEHMVLTLECSLDRERVGCFPLMTG